MKNIAVLTSGGDSPGMNACIRAIVRSANQKGIQVYGIQYGYKGLINNDFNLLTPYEVGNTIHIGGTILKSARSYEFKTKKGRNKAYNNLQLNNIDGLIVLGGDGSLTGAKIFVEEFNFLHSFVIISYLLYYQYRFVFYLFTSHQCSCYCLHSIL